MQTRNVLHVSAFAKRQMLDLLNRLSGRNLNGIYAMGRSADGAVCLRFKKKDAPLEAGTASAGERPR